MREQNKDAIFIFYLIEFLIRDIRQRDHIREKNYQFILPSTAITRSRAILGKETGPAPGNWGS